MKPTNKQLQTIDYLNDVLLPTQKNMCSKCKSDDCVSCVWESFKFRSEEAERMKE
jgi:hypothetical protein